MFISYVPISRRKLLATTGGVAAGMAFAGIAPRSSWSATNTLNMRAVYELRNFDPPNTTTDEDTEIIFAIYPGLTRYTPSYGPGEPFSWELDVASAVEQVDPTHIKFTLKPGYGWTNGFGPVTAHDVKYSYERTATDTTLGYHPDWASLDRVDVTDDLNGIVVLKEANVSILDSTMPMGRGRFLSKNAMEQLDGQIGISPPATCGRYVVQEVVSKQRAVLITNPDWPGDKPDFDEVVLIQIDDDKTAELAFQAGEIDFVRRLAISSVPLYMDPPSGVILDARPSVGATWVGMNVDSPPLDDVRVREAIQLSIDVDSIIESVYFGLVPRATGMIAPGILGHRDDVVFRPRDVEKARQLLAEAGYPDGISVKLQCQNDTDHRTIAQIMQASAADAGIMIDIDAVESGTYWSLGVEDAGMWQDTQLILQAWVYAAPDPVENMSWFTCGQVGEWNWQRYCSPEYDEIYASATVEPDENRRRENFVEIQKILDASEAYLYITPGLWANLYRDSIRPATSFDGRKYLLDAFKKA